MKAIFFDRDDTLVKDNSYMHKAEELSFFPATFSTLKELQKRGYQLFIVTNQSGIGRGYFQTEDMHKFNQAMLQELTKYGIKISDIAYCPHAPEDKCDCRKPSPKLINQLCEKYNIDKSKSFMVGDKKSDALAGENAGMTGVQLKPGEIELIFNYLN